MGANHDTAVVLTEAERDAVCICPWDVVGVTPDSRHERRCTEHREAIERIVGSRLAAQPPQDDPQPNEREALAGVLAAHESLLGSDDYTRCVCGTETTNLGGLRAHVIDAVLAAGFRRDPDAGLRERVKAFAADLALVEGHDLSDRELRTVAKYAVPGVLQNHVVKSVLAKVSRNLRAALTGPTLGSES